jgi:hypothetical protein
LVTPKTPKKHLQLLGETQMIISDLNYLENTSAEILGGATFVAKKKVDIVVNVNEVIKIDKNITSVVSLVGNAATSESGATATGNNTLAESFGFANADPNSSSSNAFAVAASN